LALQKTGLSYLNSPLAQAGRNEENKSGDTRGDDDSLLQPISLLISGQQTAIRAGRHRCRFSGF